MTRDLIVLSLLVSSLTLGCGDDGTGGSTGGSGASDGSGGSESGTDGQAEAGSATGGSGSASGGEAGSASGGSTGDGDGDGGDGDGDTGLLCGDMECADCYTCATADPTACADEKLACTLDLGCVGLSTCVLGCGAVDDPGYEACYDDCVDGKPGEELYKALAACLACTVCDCPSHPEC
jgi:hypothetical protein